MIHLYAPLKWVKEQFAKVNSDIAILGGTSVVGTSQTLAFPDGFTGDNTIIIGTRVQTPYNSVVDNNYSDSYKVMFAITSAGITYVNHESNSRATNFVLMIRKIHYS